MNLEQLFNSYLQLLWDAFQYDIEIFSSGWIYYWILIPAFFYFIFFILKWVVLTAPLWVPINMISRGFKGFFKK